MITIYLTGVRTGLLTILLIVVVAVVEEDMVVGLGNP